MATLYQLSTGQVLPSVHLFDFCPELLGVEKTAVPAHAGDYLINPVLPECPAQYWTLTDDGTGLREMTEAEKTAVDGEAHAAATALAWQTVRIERDTRIAAVFWQVERLWSWRDVNDERFDADRLFTLLSYIQALRDVPQQTDDPRAPVWPALPEGVD